MSSRKRFRLDVNENHKFISPLQVRLFRTGTIAEGSCLIHSIFHAINKEYRGSTITQRKKMVEKYRKKVSEELSVEDWEQLSQGIIATIAFQDTFRTLTKAFYNYISNGRKQRLKKDSDLQELVNLIEDEKEYDEKDFDPYSEIVKTLPYKVLDDEIFAIGLNCISISIDKCQEQAVDTSVKEYEKILREEGYEKDTIDLLLDKLATLLGLIGILAKASAYSAYKKEMLKCGFFLGATHLHLLSNKLKLNLFFINSETSMPYNLGGCSDFKPNRPSVIILWVGRNHFEIIGRVLEDRTVQRMFDWKDPLIQKINTILCHPEEAKKKYPELMALYT